jgi:hypothetical protein
MKKKICMWLLGLLALSACGGEDDPLEPTVCPDPGGTTNPTDPSRPGTTKSSRTVLVYIAAENSLASFSTSDIREMEEGMQSMGQTTNNTLLVYVDNTSTPRLFRVTCDADGNVTEETVKDYEEQDSATPEVMKTVYKDAFDAYPADSYGLILWSHGEGWLPDTRVTKARWWGIDNGANSTANTGTYMELKDLGDALSSTVHFDFILFDSCFMMSAEVLYEFKDYADYFIGSPAEIPGPGMRYDLITPLFFSTEADHAEQMARDYYESYAENYNPDVTNTNSNWTAGVAICAVKSAALPALAQATAEVLPQYIQNGATPVYSTVLTYDLRSANVYYHDLKDFMHQTTGDDTATYERWLTAFDEAMVYWGTTPTIYSAFGGHIITMTDYTGGLAMFIPRFSKTDLLPAFHELKWYTAAGWDQTGW